MTPPNPAHVPSHDAGRRRALAVLGGGLVAVAVSPVRAEVWPSRPIRLLVPYPAGGATDFLGRTLGAELAAKLGQQVIVENKPGATTIVAAEALMRAPADGHTLMLADTSTLATNPNLYRKLPYDPRKDLQPVARVARIPLLLAMPGAQILDTWPELRDMLKGAPDGLNYGSPGLGSPHHLAMEMLARQVGFKAQHIPYKGAAPVLQDLLGGQIQFAFLDLPTARGAIAAGRLRAVAAGTRTRIGALPQVPTLDEMGVKGFDAFAWQGLVAPARTSAEIVARLQAMVDETLRLPAFAQKLADGGIDPFPAGAEAFAAFVAQETVRWGAVIREAGIAL